MWEILVYLYLQHWTDPYITVTNRANLKESKPQLHPGFTLGLLEWTQSPKRTLHMIVFVIYKGRYCRQQDGEREDGSASHFSA